MGKRILVIDDEEMILNAIKLIMEDLGYSVSCYSNPIEGEDIAKKEDFDLIILDLRMPQKNGAELTENIIAEKPDAKILILTAYPADPIAKRALEAGAISLLKKPFEISKILDFIEN